MKYSKSDFDVLKRIADERDKRGWTNYTLSEHSGVPQSTISTWFTKNMQPSVSSIEMICGGLGISLSEFFRDDDDKAVVLNKEALDIIDVYHKLNPAQRENLITLMKSMLDK